MYRTHNNGELRLQDVNSEVTLCGWVAKRRNFGALVFIDLRDRYGITQLVFNEDIATQISDVRNEYVLQVKGTVVERKDKNPKLATGEIEVVVREVKIVNTAITTPMIIADETDALEDTRLKYRYLDLRRPVLQKNLILRNRITLLVRNYLAKYGFTEVETPILCRSTPEGARDYLVPSRISKGQFYALPQSPQLYKQLLMVGGMDRYFQIARCFRDEDLRADRQPEFSQIDIEMSFVDEEDIWSMTEGLMKEIFKDIKGIDLPEFKRIPYDTCMEKYGSDKPDLRNPLIIEDITDILSKSTFEPFKTSHIRGITVTNIDKSNSWYKSMEEYMKSVGAVGLSYIKVNEDMTFKSSIDKFLDDSLRKELIDKCHLVPGSALFVLADSKNKINKLAGLLRIKLGSELDLIDKNKYEFCIVNDFPMYEYNEEDGKFDFGHNPFSMPQGGLEALKEDNLENVLAYQYDFVCNGYEMASGAVRNHDIKIMKRAFELAGYTEEDVETKFRSLYTAFQYGAPPHAGMAPGIDRILMLLKDEENIREMVAFPLGANGADAMMGCPGEVFEKQLRETHIKVRD